MKKNILIIFLIASNVLLSQTTVTKKLGDFYKIKVYNGINVELIKSNESIILVTSAYHMLRAKRLFENEGINVIPYKVDFSSHNNKLITIIDFLPTAENLVKTEKGLRELLGRSFYYIFY